MLKMTPCKISLICFVFEIGGFLAYIKGFALIACLLLGS